MKWWTSTSMREGIKRQKLAPPTGQNNAIFPKQMAERSCIQHVTMFMVDTISDDPIPLRF